jgi:hypothetical protein
MRTFVHLVIAIAVAISFAGCGKKPVEDSAHVKRAKELMSIGEWSNASTELKIELKDKPKDLTARGLLLYCVEQNGGKGEDRGEDLFELYVALVAMSSPEWERTASADLRDETNKSLIRLRQEFYDKGVDTTDVADLKKVIETGAAFGFEKADKPEAKDHAAGILALAGQEPAIAHLVERLKGQSADHVALYRSPWVHRPYPRSRRSRSIRRSSAAPPRCGRSPRSRRARRSKRSRRTSRRFAAPKIRAPGR